MPTCVVLQWYKCCVAHRPRLNQGIIFHHKTIIYLFFFPTRCHLGQWYHTGCFLHYIFVNTLFTMTGSPHCTHKYRVNFQIWHKFLKTIGLHALCSGVWNLCPLCLYREGPAWDMSLRYSALHKNVQSRLLPICCRKIEKWEHNVIYWYPVVLIEPDSDMSCDFKP